jgi:hypothetical protein
VIRLACLFLALASCAAPVGRLNPGVPDSYAYEIVERRNLGVTGPNVLAACGWFGIREVYADGASWVAAHEACHLADRDGISLSEAIRRLTPPGPINPHMAERLASMRRVADMGGDHWQALKNLHGVDAIQHAEILARLK